MNFLRENAIPLFIGVCSLLITYTTTTTMYGYRITALENHQTQVDQQIATLTSGSVTTQIALAQIQTQLKYITLQINKLVN